MVLHGHTKLQSYYCPTCLKDPYYSLVCNYSTGLVYIGQQLKNHLEKNLTSQPEPLRRPWSAKTGWLEGDLDDNETFLLFDAPLDKVITSMSIGHGTYNTNNLPMHIQSPHCCLKVHHGGHSYSHASPAHLMLVLGG